MVVVAAAEKSQLKVVSPAYLKDLFLKDNNEIPHDLSIEQHVPWGKSLSGKIEIADPVDACTAIKYNHELNMNSRPFLIIQQSGSCSLEQKIYHAQNHGAQLVILVMSVVNGQQDSGSNNPTGGSTVSNKLRLTTIPVLSVSASIGTSLIEAVRNSNADSRPTLIATFKQKVNSASIIQIFLDVDTLSTYYLLQRIQQYSLQHQGNIVYQVDFRIPQQILDEKEGIQNAVQKIKDTYCLGDGKYCDFSSESAMLEIIRQKCISDYSIMDYFNYASAISEDLAKYQLLFNYSDNFNFNDHTEKALLKTSMSQDTLNECVSASFIKDDDQKPPSQQENIVLSSQRQKWEQLRFTNYLPLVLLSNQQVTASSNGVTSYADEVIKQLCLSNHDDTTTTCQQVFKVKKNDTRNLNAVEIVIIVLGSLLGAVLVCCIAAKLYNRYQKRDYSNELEKVDYLVQSYMELQGEKDLQHQQQPYQAPK